MIKSQNEGQDYKVTKLQGLSDLMLSTKLACDLVSNIPADSELAVTSHVLEKVSSGEHFAHSMGQASQGVGGGQASPIQASPIQAGPDFKGRHTEIKQVIEQIEKQKISNICNICHLDFCICQDYSLCTSCNLLSTTCNCSKGLCSECTKLICECQTKYIESLKLKIKKNHNFTNDMSEQNLIDNLVTDEMQYNISELVDNRLEKNSIIPQDPGTEVELSHLDSSLQAKVSSLIQDYDVSFAKHKLDVGDFVGFQANIEVTKGARCVEKERMLKPHILNEVEPII